MDFERNVGSVDQAIRIVMGVVLFALLAMQVTPWGLLGLLPLATGLSAFCPLYRVLGIDSCERRPAAPFRGPA